ncbi:HTH-type transcriptional regulator, PadR family [Gottschalkia acidurici 9a]|uniref:HTH-type transcriptional regulator, PadR family n=1 Tax=Gottschalkia acidurici (strain ATCC 7906 / DSM 604 / BCRC 14475 / CIP 104303 / KCTC 5404 / NCIMB 10678 / 9a) TaxID=1128398 RepID=K0AV82_GOTA9|nr:PadR family transcriptional regulator [Gottschalkia acidurici]AFS77768.1 HTH-type transcriptional regulator, PadR family [Gottschalkia acidurici 9a]
MNSQFKKGVLELCVLCALSQKDCYGYELVETISENIQISEGTIYPLLRKLVKEEYCTTYLKESQEGPPRKYYTLTELGVETKNKLIKEWYEFIDGVEGILSKVK